MIRNKTTGQFLCAGLWKEMNTGKVWRTKTALRAAVALCQKNSYGTKRMRRILDDPSNYEVVVLGQVDHYSIVGLLGDQE